MRSYFIVVKQPCGSRLARLIQRQERVQVQELVSRSAVERFDVRVLDGLAGIDEVQFDAALSTPAQHRVAGQLRAVIKPQGVRKSARQRDAFEHGDHVVAREGALDVARQTFPGKIVDDRQDAQTSTAGQRVVHEVQRPALVWCADRRDCVASHVAHLALFAWPHLQAQGPIDPAEAELTDRRVLAAQRPRWGWRRLLMAQRLINCRFAPGSTDCYVCIR